MSKGKVQMTIDLYSDLTTVKVVGKATTADLVFWVRDYYAGHVTSLALWDLVDSDLADIGAAITTEQIVTYIRMVDEAAAKVRSGGKTAFVAGDNLPALRLFQQVESLARTENSPFERRTFTDMKEARRWLGI